MLPATTRTSLEKAVRDRQTIQNLRILVNRADGRNRELDRERDLARWQVILYHNKIAALEAENERLLAEVEAMAGEVKDLRARLALQR